jgi:cyclic dehypoxanthinyl futalosine synthase
MKRGNRKDAFKNTLGKQRICKKEALDLYRRPLQELGLIAHQKRLEAKKDHYEGQGGEIVTYIVDRNINYTNVCQVGCKFCAFYRSEKSAEAYVLSFEEIHPKIVELEKIGGTQILLQGGHHPHLTMDYYTNLLKKIRKNHPMINIHGFSPPELIHFSQKFNYSLEEILIQFREAGLGSIPGAGGEILVDRVRKILSPLKCSSEEWINVMRVAHRCGISSTATMMFGHIETIEERIEHLQKLRDLQDETGGFTAFIGWTFQPSHTRLPIKAVDSEEYLRMLSLGRIYLDNISNIQYSWVTQGLEVGRRALKYGANDFGGTMMEENVVSSAGIVFKVSLKDIQNQIRHAGYHPKQRNNKYDLVNREKKIT